jgi:UDPglucose 6-dehydrogenase
VLEAVESVNEEQKHRLFQKLQQAIGPDLRGTKVAVWGLAFKPNTDDMREAPALTLIEDLLKAGAGVAAHDPVAMPEAKRRLGDRVRFTDTNYDALDGADALAIVTDWNEYRHPDFGRIKTTLRQPVIVDGRNLYATAKMADMGFKYHSIGRVGAA